MSEDFFEEREVFALHSPLGEYVAARERATARFIAKRFGRRAAREFHWLIADELKTESLENLHILRHDDIRVQIMSNRSAAMQWFIDHLAGIGRAMWKGWPDI